MISADCYVIYIQCNIRKLDMYYLLYSWWYLVTFTSNLPCFLYLYEPSTFINKFLLENKYQSEGRTSCWVQKKHERKKNYKKKQPGTIKYILVIHWFNQKKCLPIFFYRKCCLTEFDQFSRKWVLQVLGIWLAKDKYCYSSPLIIIFITNFVIFSWLILQLVLAPPPTSNYILTTTLY